MKVKICGITQLADARYIAGAGADYLGFIQHRESPRYIEPQAVREIGEWIHGPERVGVFVNTPPDEVNRIAEEAHFDLVQLHGTEPVEWVQEVEPPVIKAFHVVHDASAEQLSAAMEPYREHVRFVLLDTHSTSLWGGTGESFNWRLARDLASDWDLFLAGGLTAENVEEAARTMRPYAVDLSSSLESSPGVKDFDKVFAFFEAVKTLRAA